MRQRGFTMIEVLVSALILVVGVLGVAALQVTALKNLQSSGNYGVASLVANEMVDRIWVNGEEALTNDAYLHTQPPANTPRNCEDETCTAAQLADYDIWDWQRQLTGYTVSEVGSRTAGFRFWCTEMQFRAAARTT